MIGVEGRWKHLVTPNIFVIKNLIFVQKAVKNILENQARGRVSAVAARHAQDRNQND